MKTNVIKTVILVVAAMGGIVWYLMTSPKPFVYGLDLAGGVALTYSIDTSKLPADASIKESVESLRDVVERRINIFGVREPVITTQYATLAKEWRLSVELPGVTDLTEAKKLIGETPTLDFRILSDQKKAELKLGTSTQATAQDFVQTPLTGTYVERSRLIFDQTTSQPLVELTFNSDGAKLFAAITKENKGLQVGIFLDGSPISIPFVREEITEGKATISGNFSVQEAKTLVGRLNSGALPVPISLSGTSVVPPHLGEKAVETATHAGLISFGLIALFMVIWYRLSGFVAVIALISYVIMTLALFKIIPVTLTAAGLAGFIISIGLAIDANILVFERMKEELKLGKSFEDAVRVGFDRAWTSIRDSHIAAIIISLILFWLGTSVVKGFAFTFFLGAVISLVSAQLISRLLLRVILPKNRGKLANFLFGSGFTR